MINGYDYWNIFAWRRPRRRIETDEAATVRERIRKQEHDITKRVTKTARRFG
jgi:hypothetical protein